MKNHLFLLEVFAQIKKSRPDAQLILLGEGGCMEPAKQKAAELGITESVQFLGNQGNPQDYYQAMDLFIFPSLYEGLARNGAGSAGCRASVSDVGYDHTGGCPDRTGGVQKLKGFCRELGTGSPCAFGTAERAVQPHAGNPQSRI